MYLKPSEVLSASRVCRRWNNIAYTPQLWRSVSFRPTHDGIQVKIQKKNFFFN